MSVLQVTSPIQQKGLKGPEGRGFFIRALESCGLLRKPTLASNLHEASFLALGKLNGLARADSGRRISAGENVQNPAPSQHELRYEMQMFALYRLFLDASRLQDPACSLADVGHQDSQLACNVLQSFEGGRAKDLRSLESHPEISNYLNLKNWDNQQLLNLAEKTAGFVRRTPEDYSAVLQWAEKEKALEGKTFKPTSDK